MYSIRNTIKLVAPLKTVRTMKNVTFQNGHCVPTSNQIFVTSSQPYIYILFMSKHMYSGSKNIIKKISAAFVHDLLTMSN